MAVLASPAFAEEVACPPSISVKESLEQPAPDKWSVRIDTSARYLAGVSFFDGDPKEAKSIAPVRDFPLSGKDRVALWNFGPSGEPVWLACRYLDTGISLSRQLSSSYKECRVTYGAGGIVKAIACK